MFNMSAPSLADIAAVTRNNDGNDGWGGNNGWWILIILFALFGWGRGGYGYGGNDADPDLREKMKKDFSALLQEMN